MSNRVIKDSIWSSPTLATMDTYYQDQFPRWLLLADDWGCFNADPDIIKGQAYPKRKEDRDDIIEIINTLYEIGLLFVWEDNGRIWGFITSWDTHQRFCNKANTNNGGKHQKHRRKTPSPPTEKLSEYIQGVTRTTEHFRTVWNKFLNPDPNPNLDPYLNPNVDINKTGEQENKLQEQEEPYESLRSGLEYIVKKYIRNDVIVDFLMDQLSYYDADTIISFLNQRIETIQVDGQSLCPFEIRKEDNRKPIITQLHKGVSLQTCMDLVEYMTSEREGGDWMTLLTPEILFGYAFDDNSNRAQAWIRDGKPSLI